MGKEEVELLAACGAQETDLISKWMFLKGQITVAWFKEVLKLLFCPFVLKFVHRVVP